MHFFDTNFLVLPAATLPKLNHVPNSSRWITETTRQEIVEKLGEQSTREMLDGAFQTLRFNDLYRQNPGICPVYYWYILAMYNPANVGGEDFIEDFYTSMFIRGDNITDEVRKAYEQIRRRSSRGHVLDSTGQAKAKFLRYLEDLQARTSKKAKKAVQDRHPAYLRDIRTLSLILYNTLASKKNVVFYTTDGDPIPLLLKWLESMSMRLTLETEILPRIDSGEGRTLMRGGTLEFYLNYNNFIRRRTGVFNDFVYDEWKRAGVRFEIKRWNQHQQRFEGGMWLTFPDNIAQLVSNKHGNLSCHFTKNDMAGNWLRFLYYWPPAQPEETRIRVEVTKKNLLNRTSIGVSPEPHEDTCKYRTADASGEIASWSEFV
jgi:hypothetical protein